MTLFLLFAFLSTCPGFYFRQHYFVTLLPAVALLSGAAIMHLRTMLSAPLAALVLGAALLLSLVPQSDYLFRITAHQVSRRIYGANPFPESVEVGKYLCEHASPEARIAVLGSEPQIYFYSRRLSATSHIYTYAMMESQPYALQMQNEMISDIESVQPEYLVMFTVPTSWVRRDDSPSRLFDWWDESGMARYTPVGVVEILSNDETIYKWDADALSYSPRSSNVIWIFRKRSTAESGA
jgi:hypothetical protein